MPCLEILSHDHLDSVSQRSGENNLMAEEAF